jgi:hypothetical protein
MRHLLNYLVKMLSSLRVQVLVADSNERNKAGHR